MRDVSTSDPRDLDSVEELQAGPARGMFVYMEAVRNREVGPR